MPLSTDPKKAASVLVGASRAEIEMADKAAFLILERNKDLYRVIECITYLARSKINTKNIAIYLNQYPELIRKGLKLTENYVRNFVEWIHRKTDFETQWDKVWNDSGKVYQSNMNKGIIKGVFIDLGIDHDKLSELPQAVPKPEEGPDFMVPNV